MENNPENAPERGATGYSVNEDQSGATRRLPNGGQTPDTDELLDQTFFGLGPDDWDKFVALVDAPLAPNDALLAQMRKKAPWEA